MIFVNVTNTNGSWQYVAFRSLATDTEVYMNPSVNPAYFDVTNFASLVSV